MTEPVLPSPDGFDGAAIGRGLADYLSDTVAAPLPDGMAALLTQLEPNRSAAKATRARPRTHEASDG